jgi:hypothetical protein
MKHPHRNLPFKCNRRTFFRALFQEATVVRGSFKGGQGCRLSELGSLPDDQLAQVRPIVNSDCEMFVDQGYVCCKSKTTETISKLFPAERENLVVLDVFDGRHDMGEIGSHLAQEIGWDKARAFAHARDLFLSMVQRAVCVPRDPLEPDQ